MNKFRLAGLCAVILLTEGCAYYRAVSVSTSSLGPQYEERIGKVQGKSVHGYFLGIFSTNAQLPMKQAIENAKAKEAADNLIDVTVDQRVSYFPFPFLPIITNVETIVYGTAVRYKDASLRSRPDRTGEPAPFSEPVPTLKSDKPIGAF